MTLSPQTTPQKFRVARTKEPCTHSCGFPLNHNTGSGHDKEHKQLHEMFAKQQCPQWKVCFVFRKRNRKYKKKTTLTCVLWLFLWWQTLLVHKTLANVVLLLNFHLQQFISVACPALAHTGSHAWLDEQLHRFHADEHKFVLQAVNLQIGNKNCHLYWCSECLYVFSFSSFYIFVASLAQLPSKDIYTLRIPWSRQWKIACIFD